MTDTDAPLITICRTYTFEAAHFLPNLPEHHKCRRMHGHSYLLEIRITGAPDDNGMVAGWEFEALDVLMEPIIRSVDHYLWNDKMDCPTVENMVLWLGDILSKHIKAQFTIRLHEGRRSWAEGSFNQSPLFVSDAERRRFEHAQTLGASRASALSVRPSVTEKSKERDFERWVDWSGQRGE